MTSSGSKSNLGPSANLHASLARVQALRGIVEQTLNPTPGMLQADELLDDYYSKRERDARELGYLGKVDDVMIGLGYKQPKQYPTILEAVAAGWQPKTLNAADLVAIYGEIDAVVYNIVNMTRHLSEGGAGSPVNDVVQRAIANAALELLSTQYTGDWFPMRCVPAGWAALDSYHSIFRKVRMSFFGIRRRTSVFCVPEPLNPLVDSLFRVMRS